MFMSLERTLNFRNGCTNIHIFMPKFRQLANQLLCIILHPVLSFLSILSYIYVMCVKMYAACSTCFFSYPPPEPSAPPACVPFFFRTCATFYTYSILKAASIYSRETCLNSLFLEPSKILATVYMCASRLSFCWP